MTKKVFAAAVLVAGMTSMNGSAGTRAAMLPTGSVVCMNLAKANASVTTPDGRVVEYTVNPGGNPNDIEMQFKNVVHLFIDQSGNLAMVMQDGGIRTYKATFYQTINGKTKFVSGNFRVNGTDRAQFKVGKYDTSVPLQIEAKIQQSSHFPG